MREEQRDPVPEEEFIELYGEHVSLRELALSTAISTAIAFIMYSVSPLVASVLGLSTLTGAIKITLSVVGATLGFIVSVPMTRVKRVVVEE